MTTVYDNAGRAAAMVNPLGKRTSSVFDAAGRTVASIDPLGYRATTIYDSAGQATNTISPIGARTTTQFDVAGQPVVQFDPRGYRTTTIYDAAGAASAAIDALGQRTSFVNDAAGRQIAVISALAYRTTSVFDSAGRIQATINPLGARTTTLYDAAGRRLATVNALGLRTTTVYDAGSALLAVLDPLGRRTSQVYDAAGRSVATVNGLGNRTTNVYDAASRTIAAVSSLGYRTTMSYDAAGQRTLLLDANNHRITFVFDAAGQDAGGIGPTGARVTFVYDGASNKVAKLDALGQRTTYVYDAGRRLTGRIFADGQRHTFAYDLANNRIKMADSTGVTTYSFDAKNRATLVNNPGGKRVTYTFDAIDRRTIMREPSGGRFTYAFDANNRLTLLVNPQGKRTTNVYDALDRLTRQQVGNGGRTTHLFDNGGQITGVINTKNDGTTINRFTYAFDNAGNKLLALESSGVRTTWTYDKTNQLTNEQRNGPNSLNVTHVYDRVGNRSVQIDSGIRTTYTYNAVNQTTAELSGSARTTYTLDAINQRTKKDTPTASTYYTWDAAHCLTQVVPVSSPVTMAYDADSRRAKKTVGATQKKFLYDYEKLLQEADGSDNVQHTYTQSEKQYGDMISQYDGSTTLYHQYDGLGSTDALLNDAQSATDRYAYRAYGLDTHTSGTTDQPLTFAGQEGYYRDNEIDLYLVRRRPYDFLTARFVSEDPLGYRAGDINLYRYVGNNPVNQTDPSGLFCPPFCPLALPNPFQVLAGSSSSLPLPFPNPFQPFGGSGPSLPLPLPLPPLPFLPQGGSFSGGSGFALPQFPPSLFPQIPGLSFPGQSGGVFPSPLSAVPSLPSLPGFPSPPAFLAGPSLFSSSDLLNSLGQALLAPLRDTWNSIVGPLRNAIGQEFGTGALASIQEYLQGNPAFLATQAGQAAQTVQTLAPGLLASFGGPGMWTPLLLGNITTTVSAASALLPAVLAPGGGAQDPGSILLGAMMPILSTALQQLLNTPLGAQNLGLPGLPFELFPGLAPLAHPANLVGLNPVMPFNTTPLAAVVGRILGVVLPLIQQGLVLNNPTTITQPQPLIWRFLTYLRGILAALAALPLWALLLLAAAILALVFVILNWLCLWRCNSRTAKCYRDAAQKAMDCAKNWRDLPANKFRPWNRLGCINEHDVRFYLQCAVAASACLANVGNPVGIFACPYVKPTFNCMACCQPTAVGNTSPCKTNAPPLQPGQKRILSSTGDIVRRPGAAMMLYPWQTVSLIRASLQLDPGTGEDTREQCILSLVQRGIIVTLPGNRPLGKFGPPRDHAGHIIGRQFGGGARCAGTRTGYFGNIFPQFGPENTNGFRIFETNTIAARIAAETSCEVCIEIQFQFAPSSNWPLRPTSFVYQWWDEGRPQPARMFTNP